ncbi:MAG: pyridoxamine 5'-phosphate oxidase family protein, partial [Pseudomonadota bacterium]|nr:pyridoxamine 5'-phosphate oxidase family protein [Pseudomonadota bacterium]
EGTIDITVGGGEPGFVQAPDPKRLRLPLALLDDPQFAQVGRGFGSLFLTPGIDETLRVNGRVAAVGGDAIEIDVEECYLHCAKALMRSKFWAAQPQGGSPGDVAGFIAESRFMALATIDRDGRADVSPKGDPAGAMLKLHDGAAWYADRPGNRRVDSFRNLLTQPNLAALVLIPGSARVAVLHGTAQITTGAAMREAFAVGERVPKIVTRVQQPTLELRDSAALARARPWPSAPAPADIDPAAMFVAHVKESKARGLQATIARAALNVPGLMEKGLQHDYKNNLY